MLDLNKKYWTDFYGVTVLCSIVTSSVCFNISGKPLYPNGDWPHQGPLLEELPIPEKTKEFFKNQGYRIPHADPGDEEAIEHLKEFEKIGYTVFYTIDEPIGHDITEDVMIEDDGTPWDENLIVEPHMTLEEARKLSQRDLSRYKHKEYKKEWVILRDDF